MDGATSAHYGQSTRIDSLRFGSCCAMRNAVRSLRRRCCLRPAGGAATTAMRQEGPAARGRCLHPIDERGREGERRAEARETKRQEGDGVGGRRGWTARLAANLPNRWRTETVADSESASEDSSQAGRCVADSESAGHATMKGWRGGPGDYGSLGHRLGEGRASEGRAGQTGAKAVFPRSFITATKQAGAGR